jgi:radical SAM protein with 4Fe4S-binding SPASM domain
MRRLRSPVKVSIDITSRCNLSCSHCRSRTGAGSAGEMDSSVICSVIDDLAAMRVFRIAISGGEPFLRDDAAGIIRYAASRSPGRVLVSTNGTYIDRELLRELAPSKDRLTVKISLDGPAAVHDPFRGVPGAFDAARRAIRLCREEGFRVEVTSTVSRNTISHLRWLARFVMAERCARYTVMEVVPVGRATWAICLDAGERAKAREILDEVRKESRVSGPDFVVKIPFSGPGPHALRCNGGISECGILQDGTVVGCRLLPHLGEGNVRERPLSLIWSDPRSFQVFRGSSRTAGDPGCRSCLQAAACGGGCRAYAFGLAGSLSNRDPRCPGPSGPDRDPGQWDAPWRSLGG